MAPRFVALAGLTSAASGIRRATRVGCFIAGISASYVLIGLVAGALGYLSAYSAYVYALLGSGFILAGVFTIVRTPGKRCPDHVPAQFRVTHGTAFVSGLAFAMVGSPCCGPIAAAIAGSGVAVGSAGGRAALLASFALGHAAPLAAVAVGFVPLEKVVRDRFPLSARATVTGALMVALGSYYVLLA